MATAKKTPAKKAPVKRAAAAKAAPVKRVVRRKPKAVEPLTGEQQDTTTINLQDLLAHAVGVAEAVNGEAAGAESMAAKIEGIEVISLREVPFFVRFGVVQFLQQLGYVFSHSLDKPATEDFTTYSVASALKLNHNNKLITAITWAEAEQSMAVANVEAFHTEPQPSFSIPGPVRADMLMVEGAWYARVK